MYPEYYGTHPLFPQSNDFSVTYKDEFNGLGVMTFRAFEPGDLLAQFTGELLTEITQHSLQIEPGLYINDLYFVGYLLHSCDPNVVLDMAERRVYAVKSIQPFDFLSMDYAQTEDVLFRQFPCSCGSIDCRRWITGRSEVPNEHDPLYQELMGVRESAACPPL